MGRAQGGGHGHNGRMGRAQGGGHGHNGRMGRAQGPRPGAAATGTTD
jgi:hypothetical protein